MNNFEKQMEKEFNKGPGLNANMSQLLRSEITKTFDDKLKMVRYMTWSFLVIDVVIMVVAANRFRYTNDIKTMIMLAIVFLVGFESSILIKLWYWVVNNKLSVLKEIKRLELQIAQLAAPKPKTEN